jgi:transcriptional regulator GlxA family with amidase domain
MTARIAIYLYPDVEVLDFAGPYEVFTTASRVARKRNPGQSDPFEVFTVARSTSLVRARAGLAVHPDFNLANHPPFDVLVVPGGVVTRELDDVNLIRWISQRHSETRLTASVCTGAFLLAKAGLLDGKEVTTHWEDIADLRTMFPALTVRQDRRWVDQGRLVTSGGISAGIDMALHLVERLVDRDLALATARQMEFDWRQNLE